MLEKISIRTTILPRKTRSNAVAYSQNHFDLVTPTIHPQVQRRNLLRRLQRRNAVALGTQHFQNLIQRYQTASRSQ